MNRCPASCGLSSQCQSLETVLGILRSEYPKPKHAAGLLQSGVQVFRLERRTQAVRSFVGGTSGCRSVHRRAAATHSKLTVKQHLAALRMLFDWLVVGHVMDVNPAHAVRGPKHVVKKGKTPVLTADEARVLLDSIDTSTVMGLRDRALIALMAYTFARIGAAVAMRVEDYFVQGRRSWVRLYEKGDKQHEVPAHHNLDDYMEAYIKVAGLQDDAKGVLFRTIAGKTGRLTPLPLSQAGVREPQELRLRLEATRFGRPALPRISRMVASWRLRS